MSQSLVRRLSPEEEELEAKKLELEGLEIELAERELELRTSQSELEVFAVRYHRKMGPLYVQLDELLATNAEQVAAEAPDDEEAERRAKEARKQAEESASAYDEHDDGDLEDQAKEPPSAELKSLYRKLARRYHPDLADSKEDVPARVAMMKKINDAYARQDLAALQAIDEEAAVDPNAIKGEDVGAQLVRMIRKISRVRRRLQQIEKELAALKESSLYVLRDSVESAAEEGRDLLDELAENLEARIESWSHTTA